MNVVTLTEKAPAKINLLLDIVGKRPDGYHDLRTVMASVSLYDELTITITPGMESGFKAIADGVEGINIAAEAARLFMNSAEVTDRDVCIHIEKNIPICAGLGGGSSDAAAVLRALNRWCPISPETLAALALELGSDVPYCLRGGVCLAQGRGEILTPMPPMPDCWIVLCTPPVTVSTAEAFRKFDALDPLNQSLAKMLDNVFEAVLPCPEIEEIKRVMNEAGAENTMMSGSGPTVFGIFLKRMQSESAFDLLQPQFPKTFLTTFV